MLHPPAQRDRIGSSLRPWSPRHEPTRPAGGADPRVRGGPSLARRPGGPLRRPGGKAGPIAEDVYRQLCRQAAPAGPELSRKILGEYSHPVAVSAYLRTGLANPECNRHLLDILIRDRWSTGLLYSLLRDTARLAGDCGDCLPYAELPGYLFDRNSKPTPDAQALEKFTGLRNAWAHQAPRQTSTGGRWCRATASGWRGSWR
jgi:hypothetical protein